MTESKEGLLTAVDLAPFLKDSSMPDAVAGHLNEIIERRSMGKKLAGVIETTADSKMWPMVSIEVRMRELINSMVQNMLLSEQEVKETVVKAIKAAASAMDLRAEATKIIGQELERSLRRSIESAFQSMLWNEDVKKAMRTALIKELEKGGEY